MVPLGLVTQWLSVSRWRMGLGSLLELVGRRPLFLQNQWPSPAHCKMPRTEPSPWLRICCVAQPVSSSPHEGPGALSKPCPHPRDPGQGQVLDPHPSPCDCQLLQDVSRFQLVPSHWQQTNFPCIFVPWPQPRAARGRARARAGVRS